MSDGRTVSARLWRSSSWARLSGGPSGAENGTRLPPVSPFSWRISSRLARAIGGSRSMGTNPPGDCDRARHLSRDRFPAIAHAAPSRRAAALFSNAGQVGSVLAALGAGVLAHKFGYASIFVACAIFSAGGLVMVSLVRSEPD